MAEIKLTQNQKAAVEDRSGTLLVAAAAGSGKTAILTKRIIDKLCDESCSADISQFLIVTFTKAATGELRQRLYDGLSSVIKSNPSAARARRQLSLIGLAKISTIHSFCFDVIRRNFEALSLPSSLKIGEQTELDVLLRNTLEEIISEKYESADGGDLFLKSVEILSGARSDESFFESLSELYKKLRGISEYDRKFALYLEKYREVENSDEIFDTYFGSLIKANVEFELGSYISQLDCLLYEVSLDEEMTRLLYTQIEDDIDQYRKILSHLDSGYEGFRTVCGTFKAKSAGRKGKETDEEYLKTLKARRGKVNDSFKRLSLCYFGAESRILKNAAKESREVLETIYGILCELDDRYREKKLERGLLDYSDLEQYALKLLVKDTGEFGTPFERTELAVNLSREYAEIYVDEYQDTNGLQDMIFRAISHYDRDRGTENNRFLVGDLKQSIYRFRGAQPDIFASYIKDFSDISSEEAKSNTTHKIYLSNNFRCSESVINFTNTVFDRIMSDYKSDDRLIYSKSEECKVEAPCELVLLNSPEENPEQYSDEALYIAKRIRDMAYNPNYKSEKGKVYEYRDFAVITRSANAVSEQYRRAFRAMGVPLSSDSPESFFERSEVLLAMCLFNCVDNPQRDIYTAGLMFSPLFGFSADELCEIRTYGRHISYWSCCEVFVACSENSELKEKCKSFIDTINGFRRLSRGTPTDTLIFEMFTKTGLFDLYGDKESEKRKSILRIYEMARSFEKTSFRGLSAFLDYLSDKAKGEDDYRFEESSNSVKLMSIHRSKGLEYPVVFLARTTSHFNTKDENNPIIFSTKTGIGIKLRDTFDTSITDVKNNFTAINTPFREAIRFSERQDMLEEEKRLLYVAMTRARDRLIVTGLTREFEALRLECEKKNSGSFETYGKYAMSYFDFLILCISEKQVSELFGKKEDATANGSLICYSEFVGTDYLAKNRKSTDDTAIQLDTSKVADYTSIIEEAKKRTPYKSVLSSVAAKISVSRLKKGLLDEEEAVAMETAIKKMPKFMQKDTEADSAEKGTAAHTFMQFASYENLEKMGAKCEADRLLEMGFITKRMREILDLSILDAFTKSNLYKDIKKASKLYRERRFNLKLSASEFTEKDKDALSDEFILVQGVSDLYYIGEDGKITLVDFKTDRVNETDGETVLKSRHTMQLSYYKRAIEEITGIEVSKVYIYSFSLGREILLDLQ